MSPGFTCKSPFKRLSNLGLMFLSEQNYYLTWLRFTSDVSPQQPQTNLNTLHQNSRKIPTPMITTPRHRNDLLPSFASKKFWKLQKHSPHWLPGLTSWSSIMFSAKSCGRNRVWSLELCLWQLGFVSVGIRWNGWCLFRLMGNSWDSKPFRCLKEKSQGANQDVQWPEWRR